MDTRIYILLILGCSVVYGQMEGRSDKSDWAFQWYIGEPFRFDCDTSKLNVSLNGLTVKWDTPTHRGLYGNNKVADFETSSLKGVSDAQLLVKNVQPPLHGVYKCHIFNGNYTVKEGMVVYGLNIHEPKYHSMTDRYRNNIIVAFVSTAVFIVPFGLICFVWRFQYRTPEQKEKLAEQRRNQKYMYRVNEEHEMKQKVPDDIATSVESPLGNGAYENPENPTRM